MKFPDLITQLLSIPNGVYRKVELHRLVGRKCAN